MEECAWCLKERPLLVDHHYPIPNRLGGEDTVRICVECHAKCHTGSLYVDCTSALDEAGYQQMVGDKVRAKIAADFPGLEIADGQPIPYDRVFALDPPWKMGLAPEKQKAILEAFESAREWTAAQ